jgi:phage shock protein PspC (stress-responsive transcriptional regulator)
MKKTIQVNLNGQVFTLDEDAYERLSGYLNRIGRLYENSPGKDDILSDIEARIAELLVERMDDRKQVINIQDIQEVMEVMGDPEQFEAETADEPNAEGSYYSAKSERKRLFRDPDNPMIGGVCSGIGYYFGIDPIWIRLAFAVALIFFGTGVLFYILLWIVIPVAKTTSDRLSMKGEPVNIGNIGKTIEKELDGFGERVSKAGDRFSKGSGRKIERGIDRFFYFLAELLRGFFAVLGKVIGGAFILIGVLTIVALVAGIFGVADIIHFGSNDWDSSMSLYEWGDIVFHSAEWMFLAVFAGFLLIGIPFIALVYGGLVLLFPQVKVPYLGASLVGMWFIGVILSILAGFSIAQEFSKEETRFDRIPMAEMGLVGDTLIIETGDDPFNISERRAYYSRNDFMMKVDDRQIVVGNIDFTVLRSNDDQVWLELNRTAKASSYEEAERRADSIRYHFTVDSNRLLMNAYFSYPQLYLLRDQEVEATLRIPNGTTIYLAENIKRIIEDIPNVNDTYDPQMVGHYWRMEEAGLTCLDCQATEDEDDDELDDEAPEVPTTESTAPAAA